MKQVPIVAAVLLLSACSYMGGGRPDSKKAFKPPAGTFEVNQYADVPVFKDVEKDKEQTEEAPQEVAASEAAPAVEDNDERAHLIEKKAPTKLSAPNGIPPDFFEQGSAREIDVRAERLHRLLSTRDPEVLAGGKVFVRANTKGRVDVILEIPITKDLSMGELARIAREVQESAAKAIPEAKNPEKYLVIEVNAGKKQLATWEDGGWHFAEIPNDPLLEKE